MSNYNGQHHPRRLGGLLIWFVLLIIFLPTITNVFTGVVSDVVNSFMVLLSEAWPYLVAAFLIILALITYRFWRKYQDR